MKKRVFKKWIPVLAVLCLAAGLLAGRMRRIFRGSGKEHGIWCGGRRRIHAGGEYRGF